MQVTRNPWDLDGPTIFWIIWGIAFFVGEYWGRQYGNEMLTHHIWWVRNWASQTGASIILFLMGSILLWINWHFWIEGWKFFKELMG